MNSLNGKSILIAGASGYLGGFVLRAARERGLRTRILVRKTSQAQPLAKWSDEIVEARATEAGSVAGITRGMDYVFSSIGITRQRDGLTYRDVDLGANLNLLRDAGQTGVKRFVYVSVLNPQVFGTNPMVAAKEEFCRILQSSELPGLIIRPTGFFNDMREFYEMARRGRVYLFGNGRTRINPVHGADLAAFIMDALARAESGASLSSARPSGDTFADFSAGNVLNAYANMNTGEVKNTACVELDVGGPQIYTQNEIARLAFEVLKKPVKVTHVPAWIGSLVAALLRIFNRRLYAIVDFILKGSETDMVGPPSGTHSLRSFYRELRAANQSR
ncbi:MAG: SDR family oxidoreductase [Leptospiraceae bacterium]|nr:SDR family oxidoreductase [Leptospiraceae bacterium]